MSGGQCQFVQGRWPTIAGPAPPTRGRLKRLATCDLSTPSLYTTVDAWARDQIRCENGEGPYLFKVRAPISNRTVTQRNFFGPFLYDLADKIVAFHPEWAEALLRARAPGRNPPWIAPTVVFRDESLQKLVPDHVERELGGIHRGLSEFICMDLLPFDTNQAVSAVRRLMARGLW